VPGVKPESGPETIPRAPKPGDAVSQPRSSNKAEKAAADEVADLFMKMRAEQKLAPLKRFNTQDTRYLCARDWVRPYPGYEILSDWQGLANYVTREPGKPTLALVKLATQRNERVQRFSVEACETGRPGEYRVVAALWTSAWETMSNRIPTCRDDSLLWPFCLL